MRSYSPPAGGSQTLSLKAFRRARWQAMMERITAKLTGQSADLLCYWEVQEYLGSEVSRKIGLQEIRLANIVGSVERCGDYTREFLPLKDSDQRRWTSIQAALAEARPLPPIRVFQIGEVYFVVDGNHRVSVARQSGLTHIQANVVQIQTKARLSSKDQLSDLFPKGAYARFLERTYLDEIRPEADLQLTVPNRYQAFEVQLESHRVFLALDRRQEATPKEATADWYDNVYLPMVNAIRNGNLLRDFPGWTEADLYLVLCEHRLALEAAVGQMVELELAAADLARQLCPLRRQRQTRLRQAFSRTLRHWTT